MDVLVLSDETPLRDTHDRVARKYCDLTASLEARGCSVVLGLLRGEETVRAPVEARGIRVISLNFKHYWDAMGAVRLLAKELRARHYDIVCGREVIPGIIAGAATRLAKSGATSQFVRYHTYGGMDLNAASRAAANLCHYTLAVSDSVAAYARMNDRISEDRIHVSHLGRAPLPLAAAEQRDEIRRALHIPLGAAVVAIVARLRHEKGVDVALEAATHLPEFAGLPAHIVIVGSGPEEEKLRTFAARTLGERAHFVGNQNDVAPWFSVADVVAVPSRREAFGYTAIEAMSLGIPVVATKVGGLPEVIDDGRTGILVSPGEHEDVADALTRVLESPEIRSQMGSAARARFHDHFTLEAMAERWVSIWREIAGKTSRGVAVRA